MKVVACIIILGIIVSSCQKELADPVTTPPQTGITDSSVILTRIAAYNYGQPDTLTSVFRKNMINGVKGYIVTTTQKLYPHSTYITSFGYDNSGHLTTLDYKDPADPLYYSKVTLTWDQNRITRIKWDDRSSGSYGMDRSYHYEMINDTLLISYAYNVGRDVYLDSFTVNIFAEKNFSKLYRIFTSCDFDFTPRFGEKGAYYNERIYKYTGNDIASVSFFGETYFTSPSAPHSYESFDAVFNFTRQQQVNPILSDLENDMFGKEFKMLCYHEGQDTVAYFLSDIFDYSGSYNDVPNFGNTSQYFVQEHSALGASVAPLLTATVDYKLATETGTVGQETGYVYVDAAYTLDNLKRIKTIKRYLPGTNNLLVDYSFSYP